MKIRKPTGWRLMLALVAMGLCDPTAAWAAVPSGATTSLEALRQAYINAVKARNEAALESLFDMTVLTPKERADDRRDFIETDIANGITDAMLEDPASDSNDIFARHHLHFVQPIVKILETRFDTHYVQGLKYRISYSSGRYYFIWPVQDGTGRSAQQGRR